MLWATVVSADACTRAARARSRMKPGAALVKTARRAGPSKVTGKLRAANAPQAILQCNVHHGALRALVGNFRICLVQQGAMVLLFARRDTVSHVCLVLT